MAMKPDPRNHAPTAQSARGDGTSGDGGDGGWMERARSAYYTSTSFVDSNYRKTWEDGIRAFNSQHSTDSKYNQPAFDKRSKVFRPKTRAVIRKTEAAAAAAFFSNMDTVSVLPSDASDKKEAASADIMKELLQYRLTKSIPWYQIVLGGLQDAQVTGVACAHIFWDYKESSPEQEVEDAIPEMLGAALEAAESEYPEQGAMPAGAFAATEDGQLVDQPVEKTVVVQGSMELKPRVLVDKPVVELFPVENLRLDPGASWVDPINTSPYLIHLMPMYVLDIKAKMQAGEWQMMSDAVIGAATESNPDSTRLARHKGQEDPYTADGRSIGDYEIVWVQRHIHRRDEQDWEFYTLSDVAMLSTPVPLSDIVFYGKRPYVMGNCILETHKVIPSSVPALSKGLQDETNEIANQRMDNVKFVLNKKWFVKRGKEADLAGLVRNVPGGVVMLDDPVNDVREITWPDVTQSAFEEQRGINLEMDELLGNFNPAALMVQGAGQAPARNMAMLNQSNGTMVEYLIRTYVETFVQPILRHLVQLEQYYESDSVVLKTAAKRAKLFQRYGMDEHTDELLKAELTLTVNVGMGATDPMAKLNKFITGISTYTQMLKTPTPGIDMVEVGKEIFGHLGYADGTRFFSTDDPQKAMLQQQMQQLQQQVQQLSAKLQEKKDSQLTSLQKAREKNQTDLQKVTIQEKAANQRALATHWRAINENQQKLSAGVVPGQRRQRPV